ncbi:hypothetical protein EXS61_02450 [Candidatus Parcubacteria bacterium]|nr:hypothetical protein [Candidatus Parcubacteria bacterium]
MNIQNLSENVQTKSGRRLVIILCCIASIGVFAVFIWLYLSPKTLPAPVVVAEPIVAWTAEDAVAKAALVNSVATRSTQPLSAHDVKVKQNILQSINRNLK